LEDSLASRTYSAWLDRKLSLPAKIVLSLVVLALTLWLSTNQGFYETCLFNPFFALTLAGFVLIYFRLRPNLVDVLWVQGAWGLLPAVDRKILHHAFSVYGILALLGLVSIAAIALRGIWSIGVERKRQAFAFLFAVVSVSSNAAAGFLHNWTAQFTPKVFDLYLYSFDASMHVQFPFLMGQAFATWHRFGDAGLVVYVGFPLVIALVFAGLLVRDRKKEVISATTAFLITGPVGVIFYSLFPALGPLYILRSRFPWYPLAIDQIAHLRLEPLGLPGFPNSMPSLHIAWVLLAWWYSKGLSIWERAIAMFFVIFTVFATLGSGEHYFVDLVVAVPFALSIYGLCALQVPWSNHQRRIAVWLGLGATVVWIEVLRFDVRMFWISPVLPWFACIATVVSGTILQWRLARISEAAAAPERVSASVVPATVA
jgi:PAP2 superfamily